MLQMSACAKSAFLAEASRDSEEQLETVSETENMSKCVSSFNIVESFFLLHMPDVIAASI